MKNFKKQCMVALLAAGMVLGSVAGARAIDFNAKGEWLVGFQAGDGSFLKKVNHNAADTNDIFNAGQRIRLQLDAVASEALSGTVYFEIGDQRWGRAANGAQLGADGVVVEVKNAYLDWVVPQTDLKFRMGIQGFVLPNVAGGSSILDDDVAAVNASYQFNENVALTVFWARPLNDNFRGWNRAAQDATATNDSNYLDNMDLFGATLNLKFDGVELTPWVMYGAVGKHAMRAWDNNAGNFTRHSTALNLLGRYGDGDNLGFVGSRKGRAYSNMFFAGLPVKIDAWDPLNIELDINYGYVEGFGRYDLTDQRRANLNWADAVKRANSRRSGWLAKALVEYKLDWGVPGIFGWYASGDDGNVKNGSERMPSISPSGNMTSFMGDGNLGWAPTDEIYDLKLSYAGTWGIGLQIRDMSFVEDLTHTFRVAYWGGTNSPSMTKYFNSRAAWNQKVSDDYWDGPYLTTHDGLLEFNLVNEYKIYENLSANLELGYIVNMIDKGTWDRRWMNDSISRQDAWKAQLVFRYAF